MNHSAAQQVLEEYLRELHDGLRGIPAEEAREIVDEIRSHIRDSASESGRLDPAVVEASLERFGPARELAAKYAMQNMAARAQSSGSLFLALKTLFRWAKLSSAGLVVFIAGLIGYAMVGVFAYAALAKPFSPDRFGLWRLPDPKDLSLSLGRVDQPGAQELLGWWIIPLSIWLATAFLLLTQRLVTWAIRHLRASSAILPPTSAHD